MLPTDPYATPEGTRGFQYTPDQVGETLGENSQLGWGEAEPFDYTGGRSAAMPTMPQPGLGPALGSAPPSPPPQDQQMAMRGHPAQGLIEAALSRFGNFDPRTPPPGDMWRLMEDLRARNSKRMQPPRPNPLRAAALIELGKLMAENGRTMKQHHALLEAYHAMQGPGAQGGGGGGEGGGY